MGLWVEFEGYLEFNKEMDPKLKRKVNDYINHESWMDPHQPYGTKCPWYIDENDRLVPVPVKFYDHEVWLQHLLREFFRPEGYDVNGLLLYTFEGSTNKKEIFVWESWFFTKQFIVDESVSYEDVRCAFEIMERNKIDLKNLQEALISMFVKDPENIMKAIKEQNLA